jgi:hypothetical protein
VLSIYFLVLSKRTRVRYGMLEMGCFFAFGALLLMFLQRVVLVGDALPLMLQAYGWRNYFLYLPLAFVMGRYLSLTDLERVSRFTIHASLAMAVLAALQFASPPTAVINAGFGDNPDELYRNQGLPGGFVRPFGTFTSSVGMGAFTVSALAMSIPFWLRQSASLSRKRWAGLACAALGPFGCLALSGSRGALVAAGLVVLLGTTGLLLAPGEIGVKAACLTGALVTGGLISAPLVFPEASRAFAARWSDAGDNERQEYGSGGIAGRAINELFNFRVLFDVTPVEGYGLGSAGNAAWRLGTRNQVVMFTSDEQFAAAESDWGRNVLELGPLFGTLFICYRIAFALWLAQQTLSATVRSTNPLPWLLFTFVGVILFSGQITGNGTLNGYGWVFIGFCLAAVNAVQGPVLSRRGTAMPLNSSKRQRSWRGLAASGPHVPSTQVYESI